MGSQSLKEKVKEKETARSKISRVRHWGVIYNSIQQVGLNFAFHFCSQAFLNMLSHQVFERCGPKSEEGCMFLALAD